MAQLIVLGSGDPLCDERVQSSLAVPLEGGETLLIDTTSGTALLRQLRQANLSLSSIRHVFISHRHFDHAGGLAPLLTTLTSMPEARITVYAAHDTLHALRAVLALTIPGVEDWLGSRLRWRDLTVGREVETGSAVLTPFAVDHGLECLGVRLALCGANAVFSADTRPCPALVEYASGADLLIHEAYGPVTTAEQAHGFGHSTAADAGLAARAAGAGRLLLTHLRASRFADPVALGAEAAETFGQRVELAADLGVVQF
jgi:ribonuclease Z